MGFGARVRSFFRSLGPLHWALGLSVAAHAALLTIRFVDPQAFDRFAISRVPSFVLVRDATRPVSCASGSCASADSFLRSSGDVSLDYALEHMQRSVPGFGPAAELFLKRIRG